MTEADWLVCVYPTPMLEQIQPVTSRKLRLFAVGCCRRIWSQLADFPSGHAVEAAELFTDEQLDQDQLAAVVSSAMNYAQDCFPGHEAPDARAYAASAAVDASVNRMPYSLRSACSCADCSSSAAACAAAELVENVRYDKALEATDLTERAAQTELIRCIFGNPFRPIAFDPAWRTDTALALARQMYDSREFSAMPILADALQDAGCDSDDILSHCREPGTHVRGCWVVDLVLGKE